MEFGLWLEELPPSQFIRYSISLWGFPMILALHTVGLAWLVGPAAVIGLRVLGLGQALSLRQLARFHPVMVAGFWLNLVTGVALVMAYATTTGRNPLLYIKVGLIVCAVVVMRRMMRRALWAPDADSRTITRSDKALAAASLGLWALAIVTGRMMAYQDLLYSIFA